MVSRSKALKQDPERQCSATETVVASRSEVAGFARLWRQRHWLLLCLDVAACFGSFIGVYYLRFHADFLDLSVLSLSPFNPSVDPYLKAATLTTAIWIFLLAREGNYRDHLNFATALTYRIQVVLMTGFYAIVFLMVISFMFRYLLLSRVVYVVGFASACTFMILVRFCFSLVEHRLADQCVTVYRVLVLGWSKNVETLLQRLQGKNQCTHVLGRLTWDRDRNAGVADWSQVPVLGSVEDLEDIYTRTPFDQLLVVADGNGEDGSVKYQETIIRALNFSEERGIYFYMVPELFDVIVTRTELGSFSGIPLIRLQDASLHPIYGVVKRVLDVLVAAAVLVLGLPLWLLIAALIKLTTKGPVIYIQARAGAYGKPFSMFKFRSMVKDADQKLHEMIDFNALKEPVFKFQNDSRVTSVGRILRRLGLDEIPQLLNVLIGQMSLVGPRPEQVELVQRYNTRQRRRLKARPGITGYQQVMSRGELSLEKRIEYDLYYLKHQSFFLDLFIIAKTLLVIARGDGMK